MTGPAPAPSRIAGAPISWGVCEVPGWGHQLPAERVLAEMACVGLTATELGPAGFLPPDPVPLLARHGLRALGGFVPVLGHLPDLDPVPAVTAALDTFTAAGAEVLVLSAVTGATGYDAPTHLDAHGWRTLLTRLGELVGLAADHGVRAVLHPHVGTLVETPADVDRVLDGCAVPLCLDTGHLLIGGGDPVALAAAAGERIGHVHVKDVDAALAGRVRDGALSYSAAVRAGLYRPVGHGDVDLAGVIEALAATGYDGWWVLEQDTILAGPPPDPGPVAGVRTSLTELRALLDPGRRPDR